MAYICKQIAPVSAANLLALVEAELVNMGWLLHDNVSATVKVYSSDAESGNELTQYIWFSLAGVTITTTAYMWWNNAAHSGNSQTAPRTFTYSAGGFYVIVGNKDLVLIRRVAGAKDILFGHLPKRFHTTPFATLTAPCLAGNGIVLSLDNITNFVLNQTYWICGAAGEGRWRANVVGLGIGTITVDNLGSALSAGSKIGAIPSLFGVSDVAALTFYVVWNRTLTGTGGLAADVAISSDLIGNVTAFDPDHSLGYALAPYNTPGMYVLQPLKFIQDPVRFVHGISDSIFLATPVKVAENTIGTTSSGAPIDTGTASAGANFTLTCAGKVWGINTHQNKIVIIASGTGLGQTRKIASNTDDELTVGVQWDTNPNNTSIFFICDSAYRVPTTMIDIAYKEEI